jgi:Mg2+ and Co2+ transporter CorA
LKCGNEIENGGLCEHLRKIHEENIEPYVELLQKKVEELESNMLKEKRNSKLNIIHDERLIKQPGPKLTNIHEEQMEE